MEDLNGHVGKREVSEEKIMGPYNNGYRNKNSNAIIEFCQSGKRPKNIKHLV